MRREDIATLGVGCGGVLYGGYLAYTENIAWLFLVAMAGWYGLSVLSVRYPHRSKRTREATPEPPTEPYQDRDSLWHDEDAPSGAAFTPWRERDTSWSQVALIGAVVLAIAVLHAFFT
jgi:hypothetical protein